MLFLACFFLWDCVIVTGLLVRYDFSPRERLCLFVRMSFCSIGVALFGAGAVYEIVRLVRIYG